MYHVCYTIIHVHVLYMYYCNVYRCVLPVVYMYFMSQIIIAILLLFHRLSEQSLLAADHKKLVQMLRSRYEESVEWNLKYKVL